MEYTQSVLCEFETQRGTFPQKVGILGGTFNPVHAGHIDLAFKVYHEFCLSKITFMLSGNPPHKPQETLVPCHHRLNMLAIAAKEYPFFSVSNLETLRSGPIYTVDTLHLLAREQQGCEFYFIIGSDTLFELETWKNIEEVFRLTYFICMKRPGNSTLDILTEIQRLNDKYAKRIFLSSYTGIPISSTAIRESIQQGRYPVENLPEDVEAYINQYGLYK